MAKKDFTNVKTDNIYSNTITDATQEKKPRKERKTYTPEEQAEFLQSMRTVGHKGVKLPRINVAFSPDIYDYVKTMSKASGMTYTEFINKILRDHKADHEEMYQRAVDFRNNI